jgi:hypothetical protein
MSGGWLNGKPFRVRDTSIAGSDGGKPNSIHG